MISKTRVQENVLLNRKQHKIIRERLYLETQKENIGKNFEMEQEFNQLTQTDRQTDRHTRIHMCMIKFLCNHICS